MFGSEHGKKTKFPAHGIFSFANNWLVIYIYKLDVDEYQFQPYIRREIKNSEISMLLKIDRLNPKPLYQQIIDGIIALVDQGVIGFDQALPPTRNLARKLGVNRSTVVRAYEELQALGYIHSTSGSYTTVQKRRKEVEYDPERQSLLDWAKISNSPARRLYDIFLRYRPEGPINGKSKSDAINLSQLDLDPRLYPLKEFRRCVNQVLHETGSDSLQYGTYKGFPPLRQHIARRLRLHGISISEEEILVTNGAQQGIDLLIRVLSGPGKKIAVEAPTYSNIIPILKFNGVIILEIPMKKDGMDLDFLSSALAQDQVSFVYTIPNFQNPTGITTNHQHREKLLSICLRHKVPIVEDGFEEDMKYFGKVPLPIKSIDEKNIVIYLGTFSKALFPGLRIGWIIADKECINRITALKRFSDLTSGNLSQIVLYEFLKKGYYALHLKRLHRIFRKRMSTALKTMEECFPKNVSWTHPTGGYTIWVKMPKKMDERRLHELTSKFGVVVSPGNYYFPRSSLSAYIRVSIAQIDEDQIKDGLARLGQALSSLSKGNG